jgi:hypothetical protein
MSALSMQYKGFRLLLEEDTKKEMFIDHVKIHESINSTTLYLDNIRPYEATEAYMFAPLGYWKAVYQDELYPDDYPYDLMPGINSSTVTIEVKTDVMDGEYDYFYYCSNEWRKISILIKNHKIIKINNTDTSAFINETLYNIQVTSGLSVNLNVNSQFISDIPTEIAVRQVDAQELPTSITVKRWDKSNLNSDFIVTYINEIPTTLFVNGHSDLPTNIIVKITRDSSIPTDLTVVQHDGSSLPTNITVKYTIAQDIPTEMMVYQTSNLPTEILIQRKDFNDLPSNINIQRVDRSNLPTTISVKQWGVDTPYIHATLIVVRHDKSDIPITVYIIQHAKDDLLTTMDVVTNNCSNDLTTNITVKNVLHNEIPCYLIVSKNVNAILSTTISLDNTYIHRYQDLPTTINVQKNKRYDLTTFIYVYQNAPLETIVHGLLKSHSDLPTTIDIIGCHNEEIITYLVINKQSGFESIINFNAKEKSEIPTTLTVKNNISSSINTSLIVNRKGMINAIGNITTKHYNDYSEIPITLQVIHGKTLIIPTTIMVLSKQVVLEASVSKFTQLGKSQIGTIIEVKNNETNYINTTINVVCNTIKLDAITNFVNSNHSDLPTNVNVIYERHSDLPITMRVNPLGMMENVINVIYPTHSDLLTTLHIMNTNDIDTTLVVIKSAILEAKAKLVPHQLTKRNVPCVKDSYVYNFTRLTNYGKYKYTNIAYTNKNDILRSIFGFDFACLDIPNNKSAQYFDYQTVQKALLHLYKVSSLPESATIEVYSIDDKWFETTINHVKCEELNKSYITSIPTTTKNGWVTIDITKDLNNFEELPSTKRSYFLVIKQKQKTNSIISIASIQNDNPKLAPYVSVEYYHTPPYANWLDTPTEVFVKPYVDLPTTIDIPERTVSEIPTEMTVKAQTAYDLTFSITVDVVTNIYTVDLPTTLDIIGYPCDEKGFEINVYINATPKKSNIETTLIVVRNPQKEAYVYIT